MTPSGQIKKYKQQLISLFVNNEKIVKLINEKDISNPEDLIYHNFFNFIRVPETIDEERNYICVKIDVPEVYTSSLFFKQIYNNNLCCFTSKANGYGIWWGTS